MADTNETLKRTKILRSKIRVLFKCMSSRPDLQHEQCSDRIASPSKAFHLVPEPFSAPDLEVQ